MTLAMSSHLTRRHFLQTSCLAGLGWAGLAQGPAPLGAVEPFQRSGPPRLKLGLAAYSFRDFFKDSTHDRPTNVRAESQIDMFQFIDFCAAHGCDGAELTSYYFPAEVSDEYLLRVRRHAFLRGVAISGSAVGNTFTHPPGPKRDEQMAYVKRWIDRAALLGTTHLRVFAGNREGSSAAVARKLCIEALEECGAYAGARGVLLGIENHGGIVAQSEALLDIIRTVKSPWVGLNLDTGNFHTPDPYADLAACAPYAINVQIKVELRREGESQAEPADLPRLIGMLRRAGYQGYVVLEYEAAPDPWVAVPKHLAELQRLLGAAS
jgi:sugar phosphate isomerase/epimerase